MTYAEVNSPRIQLRDVWFLLRQMQSRGLASCRNPRLVTGRLYFPTARGREAVADALALRVQRPPTIVDWRKYSRVVRAKTRRLTLTCLGFLEAKTGEAQTATVVRRQLKREHAVGLNPVIRALKDLVRQGLVRP